MTKKSLSEKITFAEGSEDIGHVQLVRAGKFKQWDGVYLEITTEMLRNMKKNFDGNVKKNKLAIDYYHSSYGDAAGWIDGVTLKAGDTEMWVDVSWTETAKTKILSKELRYLSIEFEWDYIDNETEVSHGVTLCGGGLTNRPFVKGMKEILSEFSAMIDKSPEKIDDIRKILFSEMKPKTEENTMNFEELKKALVSVALSDDQKKEVSRLVGSDAEAAKLSAEIESLKAASVDKDARIVTLSAEISAHKKEAEFSVMLSEGKAVPAQKEAFMAGDVAAFAKAAVAVNLSAKGTGGGVANTQGGDAPKTPAEAQEKLLKLSTERAKADGISLMDASEIVLSENRDLQKIAMGL